MLIAVASKDGKAINQHFGHAERFLIYEVGGAEPKLVDERKVTRYCSPEPDHSLRADVLKEIATNLTGCRAVVCSQIGPAPQAELERFGIDAFVAEGPIKPTVAELVKLL